MNEEKKYLIFMIINIMITLFLLIYVLFFYKYKGCVDESTLKCVNKFNCSTCENGFHYCGYLKDNDQVETGLKCPCHTEVSK